MPLQTGQVAYYNRKFIDTAEHIDVFIGNRARQHPTFWYDRIKRGSYELFNGMEQKSNIFHSGLGPQSGLQDWQKVRNSQVPQNGSPGYDACNYTARTASYAIETISYTGYRSAWQSEPICLSDIKYLHEGKKQAMNVAGMMAYITVAVWENWNRELYVYQAVSNGNGLIVTESGQGWIDNSAVRFSYDPFQVDDDGDNFLTVAASLKVAPLSWRLFDWIADYLNAEAPEAGLASDAGMSIYGLMMDKRDAERAIERDDQIRESFRFWNSQVLLKDYRQVAFDRFKSWLFMHDRRQMRFKKVRVDGSNIVLKRVLPFREGRAGTIGRIPEANPEYHNAEYAIGVVMMQDVVENLVPGVVSDLGSGMKFGPAPGYDGRFAWVNEYDRVLNPAREVGFFWSRYEIFPRPGMFSNRAIAFLYRRDVQVLYTEVAQGDAENIAASADEVPLATSAAAGDVDSDFRSIKVTLTKKLARATGAVTFTGVANASPTSGYILEASAAPTYVIGFASGTILNTDYVAATTKLKLA